MTDTRRRTTQIAGAVIALVAAVAAVCVGLSLAGAQAAPKHRPAPSAPTTKAPSQPASFHSYVALGDSYSAAPLVQPSDSTAGSCFRSAVNYPHLLANHLAVAGFVDRTCSGAETKDMTQSQGPGVPPQFDALSASTDLVTVSIGGNDEDVFSTLVGYCPTGASRDPQGAPCRDAMRAGGRDRLLAAVHRTSRKVDAVVHQIRLRAPHARVEVVGYPQIAPRHGTCAQLPLARGDYRYAIQVNQRLNQALRHAAKHQHVTYVDLWRASQGHDICAADPWINGKDTDPSRALNYHPFANEQAAVAQLAQAALAKRH